MAGLLDVYMLGVGVHAVHLLLQLLGGIAQIDAVAQRLGHLGLAIRTGKAEACCIVWEHDIGFHQCFTIYIIKATHYFAALLQHGFLVLTGRNGGSLKQGNIGSLAYRIGKETHGDTLSGKATHLHLCLHRGIALKTGYGHEVHEVEREFAQLGNLALYEDSHLFRVQAASQIVQRHLDDILAHLLGIINIIGQGLCIGNKDIHLVVIALVLQLHTTAEATHVMTDMKPARRTVAGKYYSLV